METHSFFRNSRALTSLFILALIAGVLFLYSSARSTQAELDNIFTEKRVEIATGGLNKYREKVNQRYGHLLQDCEKRSTYNNYIDADSRELSVNSLKEALLLHKDCGHFLVSKEQLIILELEQDIIEMSKLPKLFSSKAKVINASTVVDYWNTIFALEKERTIVFERLVEIQGEYWKHDLDKALGIISPEEREALIGALNFEANQKLTRTTELVEEVKEERRRESIFWGESFGN